MSLLGVDHVAAVKLDGDLPLQRVIEYPLYGAMQLVAGREAERVLDRGDDHPAGLDQGDGLFAHMQSQCEQAGMGKLGRDPRLSREGQLHLIVAFTEADLADYSAELVTGAAGEAQPAQLAQGFGGIGEHLL